MSSQTTLTTPAPETEAVSAPVAKCAQCPHKGTWVSCICAYEVRGLEAANEVGGS